MTSSIGDLRRIQDAFETAFSGSGEGGWLKTLRGLASVALGAVAGFVAVFAVSVGVLVAGGTTNELGFFLIIAIPNALVVGCLGGALSALTLYVGLKRPAVYLMIATVVLSLIWPFSAV